jgi:hypothetical protein
MTPRAPGASPRSSSSSEGFLAIGGERTSPGVSDGACWTV